MMMMMMMIMMTNLSVIQEMSMAQVSNTCMGFGRNYRPHQDLVRMVQWKMGAICIRCSNKTVKVFGSPRSI